MTDKRTAIRLMAYSRVLVTVSFAVGEKTIDRRPETRSIEATTEPDNRVLKLWFNGTSPGDVRVVAVKEAAH